MTTKSKSQQDKHKMSEIDDNISKLFDIKKRLGKGAYGIVWKALDRRTNETLAVKKIFDAFRDETDAQRTFREIIFLKAFRNHPNVIKLNTVYKAANNLDIYLIFEYMESDLHNIIKKGTILKDIHKRYVMYQLINAIKYIHSGNVIHRDLKPSNVLIDSKCRCKLADFGLARSVSSRPIRDTKDLSSDPIVEPLLTDYVATRWYRAPEILVASKRYTKGIDMWSLGCILGEMIRGKPLFQGSSTINQIEKIVTALPEITEHDICAVGAGFGSVLLSKQISRERKTSLDELLSDAPDDAVNMVKSLLILDPLSRLTAKQALEHSYVEKFRNSIPEIELNVDILPPFRDDVRLTVPEYRSKLYEIVQPNTDKPDKRHAMSYPKNASKHRDQKHHTPLDKSESTTKKTHKVKQHTDEKYISKDKYLSRPEKHEMETQPSVSVPSIASKALKKSIVSPAAKRKAKQPHTKSVYPANDQRVASVQQQQMDEKALYALSKTKNHSRVNESVEENGHAQAHAHYYDKRHSIDCGYGSLPDGGGGRQLPPTSPNGLLKIDSARRLQRSSSALHKGEQLNQHAQAHNLLYHHSRERATHAQALSHQQPVPVYNYNDKRTELTSGSGEQHERLNRSTPTVANVNHKPTYVRNAKSDLMPNNAPPPTVVTKTNERICYEKRLKKLEEEIEKYKKEVKSFCKETFSYTYQQSPRTQSQSHTRSHTPTRNNQPHPQPQQQQGQAHQPQAKGQQQYVQQQQQQQQHSRAAKYSGNTKTTQPNQMPSLPMVTAQPGSNTPKSNPYFRIVAKATRDYTKGDCVKGEYELAYADTGGDGGDNAYIVHNSNNSSLAPEAGNDRKHQHHQHQQHQNQRSHSHHQHQQHQQHLHHQQHQQHHQQRSRPVSKFISRPQVGEHNAKASISNYQ